MSSQEPTENTDLVALPDVARDVPVGDGLRARILAVESRHSDWDVDAFIAVLSGREQPTFDWVWPLTRALGFDPGIVDELSAVHVARMANLDLDLGRTLRSAIYGRVRLIEIVGGPSPLELAAVAEADGKAGAELAVVLGVLADQTPLPWTEDEVRQYTQLRTDELNALVPQSSTDERYSRNGLYFALSLLPEQSLATKAALIQCGLTGPATDRAAARGLLGPRIAAELVPSLASGKAAERLAAAEWLRSLGDSSVVPALRKAIEKEKVDLVKQAQMAAVESFGGSLEEYLNPERLLADATKAMAKALPPALDWIDLQDLPTVRWADGSPVDQSIISWFMVGAVKSKSAEPSPLLRRYFGQMIEDDVQRFASSVLDLWIAHDLLGMTREQAEREVRADIAEILAGYAAYRQGWAHLIRTPAELEAQIPTRVDYLMSRPAGSAVPSRGLLGLAAAGGDVTLVERTVAYINKWRGERVSQCRALVQMLAWIDHPLATQAVLAISTRFRTKTIQAEATEQARLLAERQGWTLDQLADRTIPTGGFDNDGRLELSYGPRTFTAQLGDDLKVVLFNDDSAAAIKALPDARVDEDATLARAAKAELTVAKREAKQAIKIQPERLRQAMCLQRSWGVEEFRRDLIDHPIMRRLAARLVWSAEAPGEVTSFRPLTDATMLDLDDGSVELRDDAVIRVAHDLTVPPGEGPRWLTHFADYEVPPLFTQFGRPKLPEQLPDVIDAFTGHMIGTFKLKRQMTKLGWRTGGSVGGGVVSSIVKLFPGADLQVVLEIAGMPAYAEDWTTALKSLYFLRDGRRPALTNAVPLRSLPPVLVAEIYNDVASIAAVGTGFDPDWEAKIRLGTA